MKTPISYYGGKQNMLAKILPMIPTHVQYVEPFFGGGSVYWGKEPSPAEVINDLNMACITFYRILKTQYHELQFILQATLHSEEQHREAGQILKDPESHTSLMIAWAFWIQTNMSFSHKIAAGFAFSNSGKEPHFTARRIDGLTEAYSTRLRGTQIFCRDAIDLIRLKDGPDTFFYLDPPYAESDCGHYEDLKDAYYRLLELLPDIRGKFLMSSYPSEQLAKLRKVAGFQSKDFEMNLSAGGAKRKVRTKMECLTWNYSIEETMPLFSIENLN